MASPIPLSDTLARPPASPRNGVVRVLFFGRIADACGRALEVATPRGGCRLSELRRRIGRQVEGAAEALGEPGLRVAIDQVMAVGDPWVSPGREVAFLSAFSGG